MNRRDFLQFVGISSGAAIASKALVNIPEAEKQIILLDKPKDIIIANEMPDVDFTINCLISAKYYRNENIHSQFQFGTVDVSIELQTYVEKDTASYNFLNAPKDKAAKFTFDLSNLPSAYEHLYSLNGKKFLIREYEIFTNTDHFSIVDIIGMEIA